MTTNEKITRIRQLMARDQVQAVIIPSGDPHMSEYFSEHWKTRRFVSGFTGSVGTYVITENASGLWVDGRYYDGGGFCLVPFDSVHGHERTYGQAGFHSCFRGLSFGNWFPAPVG